MAKTSIEDRLLSMKKTIESRKAEKHKAEGEQESLMRRLKDEFGFTSICDAERGLKKLEDEAQKLTTDLEAGITTLEESFQW